MTVELPELIYAWVDDPDYSHGGWSLNKEMKNAPYVRGDLYSALSKQRYELSAAWQILDDKRIVAEDRAEKAEAKLAEVTAELRVYMDAAEAHMVEHMRTIDQAESVGTAAQERIEKAEAEVERLRAHIVNLRTTWTLGDLQASDFENALQRKVENE